VWGVGGVVLGVGPHPPIPNPQSPIPNPQSPKKYIILISLNDFNSYIILINYLLIEEWYNKKNGKYI